MALSSVRRRYLLGAVALLGVGTCWVPAVAGPIDPSDPALAPFTLQTGDFQVINLQLADTVLNTSNYYVGSSPGQIRPDIVVGTGAGGNYANDGSLLVNKIDQPYDTPNHAQGTYYFGTGNPTSGPDPGGAGQFTNDTAITWDANLGQLNTALNGGKAVFYFNLNETGQDDILSGTDLLLWARASVVDASGNTVASYYLAGNPFMAGVGNFSQSHVGADLSAAAPSCVTAGGVPLHSGACTAGEILGGDKTLQYSPPDETINPTDQVPSGNFYAADPRWTYIHGDICVLGSTLVHYGTCVSGDPAGSQSVNQDLGANQAIFAAYNSDLNAFINNPAFSNYTLQIDWRMTGMDNGYEQLFITSSTVPQGVPEPGTLVLLGSGLLGLGIMRKRRRSRASTAS